ncbi:MAG: flagellar hook-basal body complex protein [Rhodobiaceae bacterium]|nr:flagellar hook-basal body complex protein [Rhodobiaceae bacterium]MCC0055770.1 flagellar hook-basal body complex protein [Rhodobiaceae bacterium]
MGIYSALASAVSGLRAQSFALETISGNIANSQTVGFKRTETSFADLVPEAAINRQSSGAVLASSRSTNTVQGDIRSADTETFVAINGDGYFVVDSQLGVVDGNPVLSGIDKYTRRGDFDRDANGYLVNGAGYFLKGLKIDAATGNPVGGLPEAVQIGNDFLPAQVTSEITLRANLAQFPLTANADPDTPGSELLDPADFTVDPTTGGTGTVVGNDVSVFLQSSISGGATTVYNAGGASTNIQFRWAKIDSAATGGSDTWNLFYLEDSNATGTDVVWRNVGQDYTFDSTGQLSPAVTSVNIPGLTINGQVIGDVNLAHGVGGLTQFADNNGNVQITELAQNGYAAGELSSVSISDSGRVVATYTNGRQLDLYQIPLATFNASNFLKKLDGGAFEATAESGAAILGSNGNIVGASLEASNTDLADEFTKLIITQQAYSAGTRIVTTSDEMLQEVLNMVR